MYECRTGHLLRLLPARLADLSVTVVETYVMETYSPNDLRRTFASLIVQSGTPLDVVQSSSVTRARRWSIVV